MPGIVKRRSSSMHAFACIFFLLQVGPASAQDLDSTVEIQEQINESSAASQSRVSDLARQAQDLLAEYRAVVGETESLRIYNDNLEKVVSDQRNEVESINRQLAGLEDCRSRYPFSN
jgi:hypothetical protein